MEADETKRTRFERKRHLLFTLQLFNSTWRLFRLIFAFLAIHRNLPSWRSVAVRLWIAKHSGDRTCCVSPFVCLRARKASSARTEHKIAGDIAHYQTTTTRSMPEKILETHAGFRFASVSPLLRSLRLNGVRRRVAEMSTAKKEESSTIRGHAACT